ncbi:MAG: IS1096 element passenger TnpR family protein [Planctomycetaceae bacterium]
MRVKLGTYWSADIEMDDSTTLAQLHDAIQCAVHFDNDHLYLFYIARTARSREREVFNHEDWDRLDCSIRDLFPLPPKHQLFYLFDFGDSWVFQVSKLRKAAHEPAEGVKYPRVVAETGERPEQYELEDDW